MLIIAVFFVLSGIDYLKENKWGIGIKFQEAIMSTGTLILSIAGIFAFSPLLGKIIGVILSPISKLLKIDPSIFPSMFLAIDMGGLGIAESMSVTMEMYLVSGVIIASTLGATISFSIPLALGLINKEYEDDFYKGLLYGLITVPIAPILASLMLKIDLKTIAINMSPLIVMVIIICIGMLKFRDKLISIFIFLGKYIQKLSIIGLLIIGFSSILGINLRGLVIPLNETLGVIGRIALFLCGAYPMIEFITDNSSNLLSKIGQLINVNKYTISALLGSLASNIIVFKSFDKLDSKGRVICTAFSISGAFVLGGQMGFVSSQTPDMLKIYIICKLVAGFLAVILAIIFTKNNIEISECEEI